MNLHYDFSLFRDFILDELLVVSEVALLTLVIQKVWLQHTAVNKTSFLTGFSSSNSILRTDLTVEELFKLFFTFFRYRNKIKSGYSENSDRICA